LSDCPLPRSLTLKIFHTLAYLFGPRRVCCAIRKTTQKSDEPRSVWVLPLNCFILSNAFINFGFNHCQHFGAWLRRSRIPSTLHARANAVHALLGLEAEIT
jgi:hypothetical protein